ncbi:MAG TPA: Smr/MutS family protein, partial [Bacilli bacterium]|nr:Smr/MutS family protein [Bacilli bacterium]
ARRLEDNRAALEIEKHNYQKLVSDVKKEQANIEKEKAKILNEAQKEAVKIIENVKKEALAILEEAKKLKNREIKHHEIVQIKQKIGELDQQTESSKPKKINRNPVVGDSVRIVKYDQYGTVLEQLKTNLWLVQVGNAMLQVKTADLEVVDQTPTQTGENTESFKNLGSFTKVASKATVSLTLDLRGLRYEEAKEKLEKYFDDCLFSGTLQFTIIHGYGTGAIRELVQSFLNKNPHVESYRFGGAGEGGMGVTVVTLKK